MTRLLSQTEINSALGELAGWSQQGNEITRTFTLPNFPAALTFACAVGHLAERANHHPDILIQYRKVTLSLSTHSEGGLTAKDFDLARRIDALA